MLRSFRHVHCLFEQSGTFRDVFRQLGIDAIDYDIRNEYGRTDVVIDLFCEINKAYSNRHSIFDNMSIYDLLLAFFPCTYFSSKNMLIFSNNSANHKYSAAEIIRRNRERARYYDILVKLFEICRRRNLQLIVENPYHMNYLLNNFPYSPAVIDMDRTLSGDVFVKRTMYYFFNIVPFPYKSSQRSSEKKYIDNLPKGRVRSEISTDYARNFVLDKIVGERHKERIATLFD